MVTFHIAVFLRGSGLFIFYLALLIVGERSGHPDVDAQLADTAKLYERLAYLLTKKLLGDEQEAGEQADILMLCVAAFGNQRRN